jgi:type IV pilus assembly protein PilF
MVKTVARLNPYENVVVVLVLMAGFLMMASGCATTGKASEAGLGPEIITPSDEPDVRRRARIRLELAVNYFESGKVAVALDEVKQALVNDPTYGDAYNLRGLIYMSLNELGQAEESFRRALGLRGTDPNVLHNYAWLLCQQQKYVEADKYFLQVLTNPAYVARSKTLMTQGLCQARAGQYEQAELTLLRAYELDAGNPVVGYNLSELLMRRGELKRAQFYIRRINNSDLANAETLWLGIKVERGLNDAVAMRQLVDQLRKRFPESRELTAYERGNFNE